LEWVDPGRAPEIRIVSPSDDGFYISHVPAKMAKDLRLKDAGEIMRLLRVKYWDEGRIRAGKLIVPKRDAEDALNAFRKMFSENLRKNGIGIKMSIGNNKEVKLEQQ